MSATVIHFDMMRKSVASVHDEDAEFELFTDTDAEARAESSASSYQEGWIISYVDILTLLLTLFVILFAMTHFQSESAPLPRSEAALIVSEKPRNPQPVQGAGEHSLAVDIMATIQEQKTDASVQMQNSVENSDNPVMTDDTASSTPGALLADTVQQDLISTTAVMMGIDDNAMQVDSYAIDGFTYLNLDATALYDDRIDVESILPVEAAIDTDEVVVVDNGQAQQHDVIAEKALTEEHAQDLAIAANKSDSVLLNQINNSGLGQLIEISEVHDRVNLVISDNVLFALGSADLKPEGEQLLKQLAAMLIETQLNISVEGHTDNVPINNAQFPSNWELSTARATMVTRLLIDNEIAADRIRAIGYADTRPRASNETTQGRERNRRVSIILHMPDTDGQGKSKDGVATRQLSAAL